jgi:hypothetical protein
LRPEAKITQLFHTSFSPTLAAFNEELPMSFQCKTRYVDRELTLREMLDDPIVQDVMRRDDVRRWQVEQLFEALRPEYRRVA